MSSDKQLIANRANAAKSTGPRTDAGKEQESLSMRLKHGLTAQRGGYARAKTLHEYDCLSGGG